MKRRISVLLCAAVLFTGLCSCTKEKKTEELRASIQAGAFSLSINTDGSVLVLHEKEILFRNDLPACARVIPNLIDTEQEVSAAYSSVEKTENGILCKAEITTEGKTVLLFSDLYSVKNEAFFLERTVCVQTVGDEAGFSSIYALYDSDGGADRNAYEYFIPSIIYKNTECLPDTAIMSNLSPQETTVKETRTGTPLVMLRNVKKERTIALVHAAPQIFSGENYYGFDCMVGNDIGYGALGYRFEKNAGAEFIYPSSEGPVSYEVSGSSVRRYEKIGEGVSHSYQLAILPQISESYTDAMCNTFLSAISFGTAEVDTVDLQKVYDLNMELYEKLYLEYEGDGDNFSAGFPFAVNVKNFDDFYKVSFQMGFIGGQTAIACEMLRDENLAERGIRILDFWTSDRIFGDVLPVVWWSPSEGGDAGSAMDYPAFLRCFVDGAEGILKAYQYEYGKGNTKPAWEKAVLKVADFLADHQNPDGSYYRAYETDGSVCAENQGESKLNTPVAVRFLCEVYKLTGNEKYKNAAVAAADYCYSELYEKLGKYVGGTPDNPNVPDKEAAVYALYAFSSIYDLTRDEKYAPAVEHAAVSVMSYIYTYDYSVKYGLNVLYRDLNIFTEGITAGWSIIATGHSAIDVYGASAYFELFKQYIRTGEKGYLTVAGLLQNNSKQAMDLSGSRGYLYQGFALEACNTADQIFYTAENGVWLPWISVAFLSPMIEAQDTFGSMDLYELAKKADCNELSSMIRE